MTQYFSYQRFQLWRAPLPTRLLLTLFNGMMVLAAAVGVLMYRVRTGLTPAGAANYYLGNEGSVRPGDALLFERSFRELLDVTHDHAFSEPFLFFILCHIFALTGAGDRVKVAVYVASFGSVLIDLGAPYLIRFVSPAFAPLQIANSVLMSVVLLALVGVPTYEMWFYRPERQESPKGDA